MSQYYLMAQLPSLDQLEEGMPLPITEDYFLELCDRLAGKRLRHALATLTLVPPREKAEEMHPLAEAWHTHERQLRLALEQARRHAMGRSTEEAHAPALPGELTAVAEEAVAMEDPMAAERLLLRHRLAFLQTLRPADPFSDGAVLHYGLKLKLLLRMRQFDEERGRLAYGNIYRSILHGDGQEGLQ